MVTIKDIEKQIKMKSFQDSVNTVNRIEKKVKRYYPKYTYKEIRKAIQKAPDYNIYDEKDAFDIIVKILKGEL